MIPRVSTFPSSLRIVLEQSAVVFAAYHRLSVEADICEQFHIITSVGVKQVQLWVASDHIDQDPGSFNEVDVALLGNGNGRRSG